eukprot:CAMPEP_0195035240 /NCGR_PEP_ID=MMETSP0326_2-20130528/69684_1 /TAXON_ID=2866 ORGANISM="Crypthecodinium cohnii, Strain Seligo" /NCGR_SAMPLE_ID=MMETSP0326_2 /ASSEMBLY_ACC=CAM_ASM_000348 /LENGTH=37 /DNA_ID= /DNA_START= /DNA_END= /DNA_ORIENTATION=
MKTEISTEQEEGNLWQLTLEVPKQPPRTCLRTGNLAV